MFKCFNLKSVQFSLAQLAYCQTILSFRNWHLYEGMITLQVDAEMLFFFKQITVNFCTIIIDK